MLPLPIVGWVSEPTFAQILGTESQATLVVRIIGSDGNIAESERGDAVITFEQPLLTPGLLLEIGSLLRRRSFL